MIEYRPLDFTTDWEWVSHTIRPILCADTCGVVATRDGKVVAAAIFDSFTITACNVHMAIEDRMVLRHSFLQVVSDIAFNQLKRKTIFGLTPDDNVKAIKLNKHIGMKDVTHIPDAYDEGVGYVITRMDKESSPWLNRLEEAA